MAKPGRNDPCPCGSGKKYKKCCLATEEAVEREQLAEAEAKRAESAATHRLHLREVNRRPPLLEELSWAGPVSAVEVSEAVDRGVWLIDGRRPEIFLAATMYDTVQTGRPPRAMM